MKNWLIIYDIRNETRLRKIAKIMEDYGERVQKSVFEVLTTKEVIKEIKVRIKRVMKEEDFVVFFDICCEDWQKQIKHGPGKYKILEDKDFHII